MDNLIISTVFTYQKYQDHQHTHPSPRAIAAPNREQLNVLVAIFEAMRSLT
jgi:hypothetical protein